MIRRQLQLVLPVLVIMMALLACAGTDTPVVYITATPQPLGTTTEPRLPNPFIPTPTPRMSTATPRQPTPNPTVPPAATTLEHVIQVGDTLSGLAFVYGTDLNTILSLNPGLTETAPLIPGQRVVVPSSPSLITPNFKIIPDSELVNSPAASTFDVAAYVKFQPGFLRVYSEQITGRWMSGAEIIQFHATAASINPRLILALLEYRSGWITNPIPGSTQMTYPMGRRDERIDGLFEQVAWAVNQLNEGYYGFRTRGFRALALPDSGRLAFSPDLNGGTVGVQYFLARTARDRAAWEYDVSPAGFFTTYMSMFGDPFQYALDPLVPPDLTQPYFTLPFPQAETWYLTSGPHGGWDASASGWAAIDFAPPTPPDELLLQQGYCYISPNWLTAMATGLVVRSADGAVVIDLDMDGDERTGWTLVYLHVSESERIPAGTVVQQGSRIGHPSCEGFYLNSIATHAHIARRYNGEWIVADCLVCIPGTVSPPFIMSGWEVKSEGGQLYQGWLQKDSEIRRALQGRDNPLNQVIW